MSTKLQAVTSVVSTLGLIATATGKLNQEQVNSIIANGTDVINASLAFFVALQLFVPRLSYAVGILIPTLQPVLEKIPFLKPDFTEAVKK